MSNDLISRDELHKQLSLYLKRCNIDRTSPSTEGLAYIINNLPTAYDVDKVVEQLEELKKEYEDPLQDYCLDYFIDRSEEIVKAGGIEAEM